MSTRLTTLANGLTVATDRMEQVETVSVGVWVQVGTRHEAAEINGVAIPPWNEATLYPKTALESLSQRFRLAPLARGPRLRFEADRDQGVFDVRLSDADGEMRFPVTGSKPVEREDPGVELTATAPGGAPVEVLVTVAGGSTPQDVSVKGAGRFDGGYASILCLLRYPEVFHAACASSPVTDFRLYDSIYTERYMWLPQENKAGYDAGSAMTYVDKLKGRLMLFFGTADDNVHPANALQLIQALQRAGKSFDVQIGPDQGHTALSMPRMMEFFIENLVMRP